MSTASATSDVVRSFLVEKFGEEDPDECIVEYLAGALSQEEDAEVHLAELEDMLSCMSPNFGAMDATRRAELLTDLFNQVGDCLKPLSNQAECREASGDSKELPCHNDAGLYEINGRKSSAYSDDHGTATTCSPQEGLVEQLMQLCPCNVSREYLRNLLDTRFNQDLEAAAEFILECDDLPARDAAFHLARQHRLQDEKEEIMALERARKSMILRFDYQEVREPSSKKGSAIDPLLGHQTEKAQPKVRYHNGMPVHLRKGEKYVVETLSEEWDGGSRGKVKTKGKRGKGFA